MPITQVRKRDGRLVKFEKEKIVSAISKAMESVSLHDAQAAEALAIKVVEDLEKKFSRQTPNIEEIQDTVEQVLIDSGSADLAKCYILYRQKRADIRQAKAALGVRDDLKLSVNAIKVLERRYLKKDETGRVVETPSEMFRRVAANVALAEKNYGAKKEEVKTKEDLFYEMMSNLEFLPNSPTLMNAGTDMQQLSACFVLPLEDSLTSIFETLKNAALIHQTGGGTGFSFSRLRPRSDPVHSTGGVASGPIAFLKVFNAATESVKQGGRRRGANMGILRVDHPDILEFIILKEKAEEMANFNLSVALTDKFMRALENDKEYDLVNPRTGQVVSKLNARRVFNMIVAMAWKSGDPGVIFIDRINKTESNPVPELGPIESTNPCGEVPLYAYESCNLGSINLSKMIIDKDAKKEVDYEKLKNTVHNAVNFLDNVIDMTKFPLKQTEEMTKSNRRIGLGVMGFADMLVVLNIPYNSEEALKTAEKIMRFIDSESKNASQNLAKQRGSFANFKKSIFKESYKAMRNATTTAIAPTGTISIIAGCSSGIEPLFAVSFIRTVMDKTELVEVNPIFEKTSKENKFYSENLMRMVARVGTIQHIKEIPDYVKKIFVTAHDITSEDHVKMQAAFQKHVDNGVSKTVNCSFDATEEDVENIYLMCYKLGCKGITIYRDRSKSDQVINIELPKNIKKIRTISGKFKDECEECY